MRQKPLAIVPVRKIAIAAVICALTLAIPTSAPAASKETRQHSAALDALERAAPAEFIFWWKARARWMNLRVGTFEKTAWWLDEIDSAREVRRAARKTLQLAAPAEWRAYLAACRAGATRAELLARSCL